MEAKLKSTSEELGKANQENTHLKDYLESRNNGKIKNITISEINHLRIKLDQLEKMLESPSQDFEKSKQDYDNLKVDLEKEKKINKGKINKIQKLL